MCRNIRVLFNFDPTATSDEIDAASLQYVRKVSGYNRPSSINEKAFKQAVEEISASTAKLLQTLKTEAKSKNREVERERQRLISAKRFKSPD